MSRAARSFIAGYFAGADDGSRVRRGGFTRMTNAAPIIGDLLRACSGPECDRPVKAKGLCEAHYSRRWKGREREPLRTCSGTECDRPVRAKGLCMAHYSQQRLLRACSGPECDRPVRAKGLCKAHYIQQWRGRELKPVRVFPLASPELA